MSWPLPVAPRRGALRAVHDQVAAFVGRFIRASFEPDAAAELDRLLAGELPPSEDPVRFLRALLWDCLEAGFFDAVAALLRAGASPWRGEAFLIDRRRWLDPHQARAWHHCDLVSRETEHLCDAPFAESWPPDALSRLAGVELPHAKGDPAPAFRCLIDAGAPAGAIFGELEARTQYMWEYACDAFEFSWIVEHTTRTAWWMEILWPLDPSRTAELAAELQHSLAQAAREGAEFWITPPPRELIGGFVAWSPLRAVWVGAVVRSAGRRAFCRPFEASMN